VKSIFSLLKKEWLIEWRQKYALNGILLYLVSTIYVCYQATKMRAGSIDAHAWNALFWIIMLFSGVNSVSKSFFQEIDGRQKYLFTLTSPEYIIMAKMIYNALLMLGLGLLQYVFYSLVMGNPLEDKGTFLLTVLLGSMGFSCILTLISGLASKVDNNQTLVAILSFPLIIPLLLICLKLSKNAIDGLASAANQDEFFMLIGLNGMILLLAYVLFPFLWRS
jgi:heme exporter protein B